MKSSEITFWKGLEANRKSQTPKEGEPLWVTDTKKFYIGDGTTPGGILQDTHVALSDSLTSTSTTTALTSKGAKALQDTKAPIASPTFTGDPKSVTPAVSDNDTSIATTAFVKSWVKTTVPLGAVFTAPPDASASVKGIAELATNAEIATGTDAERIVTPAGLREWVRVKVPLGAKFTDTISPDASATVKGVVELATLAEVKTGTDTVRAVTPAGLNSHVTDSIKHPIVTHEATVAYKAGAVVIHNGLIYTAKANIAAKAFAAGDWSVSIPDASATVKGVVELATNTETDTGTDTTRAITPAGLKHNIDPVKLSIAVHKAITYNKLGDWDATTATPATTPTSPGYYVVTVAGTTTAGGASSWIVGDRLVWDGKVFTKVSDYHADINSPIFTGDPTAPTAPPWDNDKSIANTEFVRSEIVSHAQIGKNLLINGDFSVWQRGTTFNIADGMAVSYTSDRWIVQHSTLAKKVESTERNYISVDASGRYSGIQQRIENAQLLNGKKVSLSFWWYTTSTVPIEHANVMFKFSSSDDAHRYFAGLRIQPTATPTRVEFPDIQLPSNYVKGDYLEFRLSASDLVSLGENLHISDIQLELGSECTDFEYVNPNRQIVNCGYVANNALGYHPMGVDYSSDIGGREKIWGDGTITGSNPQGEYIKYPNGDLECRGTYLFGGKTLTQPVPAVVVYMSEMFTIAMPVNFIGKPKMTHTFSSQAGGHSTANIAGVSIRDVSDHTYKIIGRFFTLSKDGLHATGSLDKWTAKGRWKL